MKNKVLNFIPVIIGIILVITGMVILKTLSAQQGIIKALPYICLGAGCGIFGHGIGNIISNRVIKNDPNLQKQLEIEQKDERNIAVANKAKARAYDLMLYVFGALMLSFALMGTDLTSILLLVFSYLLIVGFYIYYHVKYDKEM